MSSSSYALNTAWMLRCLPEWLRFQRSTHRVEETQLDCLMRVLCRNRQSEYGLKYGFQSIQTAEQFQRMVPLMGDAEFTANTDRIAGGARYVLTTESVLLMQPTSGTVQGVKLIPYTRTLRQEYQRMLAAWIGNLYQGFSGIRSGRAYWSISPANASNRRTVGGNSNWIR